MKILLGIGGFLSAIILAAALVLLIIAVAKGKIGTDKIKTPARWLTWTIILLILGFAGYWVYGYFTKSEPNRQIAGIESRRQAQEICAAAGDVWINTNNPSAKINLQMDCWSQLIHLPPNTKFNIHASEELHGIKFWNGEEWEREKLLSNLRQNNGWFGKISHKNFRLRGKGEVVITIEN